MEAAGAGGKEVVFQTGPNNPWLANAWSAHAPHPFGTIVAQELYQMGVIPAETDFRYVHAKDEFELMVKYILLQLARILVKSFN